MPRSSIGPIHTKHDGHYEITSDRLNRALGLRRASVCPSTAAHFSQALDGDLR